MNSYINKKSTQSECIKHYLFAIFAFIILFYNISICDQSKYPHLDIYIEHIKNECPQLSEQDLNDLRDILLNYPLLPKNIQEYAKKNFMLIMQSMDTVENIINNRISEVKSKKTEQIIDGLPKTIKRNVILSRKYFLKESAEIQKDLIKYHITNEREILQNEKILSYMENKPYIFYESNK